MEDERLKRAIALIKEGAELLADIASDMDVPILGENFEQNGLFHAADLLRAAARKLEED